MTADDASKDVPTSKVGIERYFMEGLLQGFK
jgi:hypothetical protein